MSNIRQIPYGVADFESVMERDLYYVDKTMFLPELENQPCAQIFIRPRRFGKSLFISMMRAYYDKACADRFDELFGSLWIGKHPTPLRNKYQVLYLDFSRIGGSVDELKEKFNSYCCGRLNDFIDTYYDEYPEINSKEMRESHSAVEKLNMLYNMAKKRRIPLFLIIDEYDNFTNVVLNESGENIYLSITHASGFYREICKLF